MMDRIGEVGLGLVGAQVHGAGFQLNTGLEVHHGHFQVTDSLAQTILKFGNDAILGAIKSAPGFLKWG